MSVTNQNPNDNHTASGIAIADGPGVIGNEENVVRGRVKAAANSIDMMSAMGMNRKDRRALSKSNKIPLIPGSIKPFVANK